MVGVYIVGVYVIMSIIVVMEVMKISMVYADKVFVRSAVQNFVVLTQIFVYDMLIYAMNVNAHWNDDLRFIFFDWFCLVDDCGDQSDELTCHHNTTVTCANQRNHCDHICHDLPNGRGIICSCNPGYRYDKESSKCEDIDECQNSTLNYCSQVCINTRGAFRCECASGFVSSGVNRTDCHPRGKIDHMQ